MSQMTDEETEDGPEERTADEQSGSSMIWWVLILIAATMTGYWIMVALNSGG